MPNGPVHDRITVAVAALGSAAMQYDTGEWRLSFIYGAMTLFSGLLFSPDLDLHSESYIRWGWLKFLWWPYKTALPHRHFLSHGLLIGVVSRIVYLHMVGGLLLIVLRWAWHVFWIGTKSDLVQEMVYIYDTGFSWYRSMDPSQLLAGFLGLWVGAESHTVADLIWSAMKGKRSG
ncbi:MAG: metal-binding protein [Blastocatellia bacterium]|nr:metal-binding protein [Blastocatellia bacterium]